MRESHFRRATHQEERTMRAVPRPKGKPYRYLTGRIGAVQHPNEPALLAAIVGRIHKESKETGGYMSK